MITHICHKCKIEKPYTNEFFYRKLKTLQKICKECRSKDDKKYRLIHKEEIRKNRGQYYQNNRKEILRKSKTYQENSVEKYKSYQTKYRQNHSEELKEYDKKYREKHDEKLNKRSKEWKQNHKEETKEYMNEYMCSRYKADIQFRIINVLRSRIRMALKNNAKFSSTVNLLGCSVGGLKEHIEKQFQSGMSWSNHGKGGWHIDHILPCASFDLRNSEEQEICFHYTNLQPLWYKENIRKSNRIL